MKKHVTNIIVFTAVILLCNAAIGAVLPKYRADAIIAQSNIKLAFVKVPVPFEPLNEGQKVEYKITCKVVKQALECGI